MNTHKTYHSAQTMGFRPLHRLTAAVGVASLGLFAGQTHAQESVEERLSALEQQLAEVEPHAKGEQGFSFNTYARSGLLLNSDGKSAPGGPYLTPAGSVGGAVGRLGNEPDTYLEAILTANNYFGNVQWLINGMSAADNDERVVGGVMEAVDSGVQTMLAYHGDHGGNQQRPLCGRGRVPMVDLQHPPGQRTGRQL